MKKLIILGTGNAMVTKVYNTCFLIEMPDGELFLTDAGGGNGIFRQLELVKAKYQKIHHMFVTHGHTDHILGVIWIMRKISDLMNKGKYEGDFHIYCHDVVKEMLLTMCKMMLKKKDFANIGKRIELHEVINDEEVDLPWAKLTAFDILSTKAKQFGYRMEFKDDGKVLTCLGDEPYNTACKKYAQNADWLLSEAFCRYGDRDIFKPYEKNHSTTKEAAEQAEELNIKNLVLYHTEDKNIEVRKETYTSEAKAYYHGNVYVPDDLETLVL